MDTGIREAISQWVYAVLKEEEGPETAIIRNKPTYDVEDVLRVLANGSGKSTGWWYCYALDVRDSDSNSDLGQTLDIVFKEEPQVIVNLLKAGASKFYLGGEDEQDVVDPDRIAL